MAENIPLPESSAKKGQLVMHVSRVDHAWQNVTDSENG
jgi:hypothetical protein